MRLPQTDYITDAPKTFDPEGAVSVEMHEGAIVTPSSKYTAVGTNSLITCIGFAVHNPVTKVTGLCHLVSDGIKSQLSTDSKDSLLGVLNGVKSGMNNVELEVRMLGARVGDDMHDGMINQILDITSDYNALVLSADLKGKGAPKGFVVDCNRWDEGVIRGGVDMVDFTNDKSTERVAEMIAQGRQSVDLNDMTVLDPIPGQILIYDGTRENRQPEPSYE